MLRDNFEMYASDIMYFMSGKDTLVVEWEVTFETYLFENTETHNFILFDLTISIYLSVERSIVSLIFQWPRFKFL